MPCPAQPKQQHIRHTNVTSGKPWSTAGHQTELVTAAGGRLTCHASHTTVGVTASVTEVCQAKQEDVPEVLKKMGAKTH